MLVIKKIHREQNQCIFNMWDVMTLSASFSTSFNIRFYRFLSSMDLSQVHNINIPTVPHYFFAAGCIVTSNGCKWPCNWWAYADDNNSSTTLQVDIQFMFSFSSMELFLSGGVFTSDGAHKELEKTLFLINFDKVEMGCILLTTLWYHLYVSNTIKAKTMCNTTYNYTIHI